MIVFSPILVGVAALFFLIGIFVVVLIFLRLFTASGRITGSLAATTAPKVSSSEFLKNLAHVTEMYQGKGGDIHIMRLPTDFLRALMSDIESAKESVNITVYIWEGGKVTEQVSDVLRKKAKEGVAVRLLLDGVGSLRKSKKQLAELTESGVQVKYFRGIRPDRLVRIHRRSHRRAMIIDGKIGYTGGIGFADYWFADSDIGGKMWKDLMFRVSGEPVKGLSTAFTELWANSVGEILGGKKYYPTDAKDKQRHDKPLQRFEKHNGTRSSFLHLSSSPSLDIHPFSKFLWYSCFCAKERIDIITPYFVPNKSFHEILKEKARAGVEVRLLLPSEDNIDQKFVRWAANSYYWDLLESGVRIFEYQPTMIHTKLLLIDGHWSIFGSGNIDFRSFELNEENVFGVQDAVLVKNLRKIFEEDLSDSKEILLSEWKRRGVWARIREKLILLFAQQF